MAGVPKIHVKHLRTALNESQATFAKRFPVAARTVRRWEAEDPQKRVAPTPMAMKHMREIHKGLPPDQQHVVAPGGRGSQGVQKRKVESKAQAETSRRFGSGAGGGLLPSTW